MRKIKQILIALVLAMMPMAISPMSYQSAPIIEMDYEIVRHLASKYKKSEEYMFRIVKNAYALGTSFPSALDILAIVEAESSFNNQAKHEAGPSVGLMQLNVRHHKLENPTDVLENMTYGVALLQSYRDLAKSNQEALVFYNMGPGAGKKVCEVKCQTEYTKKIARLKRELTQITKGGSQ